MKWNNVCSGERARREQDDQSNWEERVSVLQDFPWKKLTQKGQQGLERESVGSQSGSSAAGFQSPASSIAAAALESALQTNSPPSSPFLGGKPRPSVLQP